MTWLSPQNEERLGALETRLFIHLATRAAGLKTQRITVCDSKGESITMPTFVRGHGPPLVFVHGFGVDKESWLVLLPRINKKRAIIAMDLPGFGGATAVEPSEASPAKQARAVVDLMSQLGIDRGHLVGASMGGGISQRIASDFPDRVLSLTLLGSAASVGEKSELSHALDRGENPLLASSPKDYERLLEWIMVKKPYIPQAMLMYQGADRAARANAESALFKGFIEGPIDERLPTDFEQIKAPTLIIQGERDPVIHPVTAEMLASKLPNATLHMLRDIGHVPHVECAKKVATLIDVFATQHDPVR